MNACGHKKALAERREADLQELTTRKGASTMIT